jgi:Fe2+ transport system protein FeoA
MKHMTLIEVPVQTKARIVEIDAGRVLSGRFQSMGIYPGREIFKISQFAMRGPVAIRVGRSIFALGYGMAHKIIVEAIHETDISGR